MDSLGIVGKIVYDAVSQTGLGANGAMLLCVVIGFVIRSSGNWILKKQTTKWGEAGVSIVWKIMAALFGKGVIIDNAIIDPKLDGPAREAAVERLKEVVKKDRAFRLLNLFRN